MSPSQHEVLCSLSPAGDTVHSVLVGCKYEYSFYVTMCFILLLVTLH